MFFFLNLDLSYLWYQNVYFDIICKHVVYAPGEKLSLFTYFCSNKRFSIISHLYLRSFNIVCIILSAAHTKSYIYFSLSVPVNAS